MVISVNPENSAPTVDTGASTLSGDVRELVDRSPNENIAERKADGEFIYSDIEGDKITSANVINYDQANLGELSLSVSTSGRVKWSFSVNDADIDYLDEGEVKTQLYTVQLTDAAGSVTTETVTINIIGRLDVPNRSPVVIEATSSLEGTITELADGDTEENTKLLETSGIIDYMDQDADLVKAVTATPVDTATVMAADYIGTFTPSVDAAGVVSWDFKVNDAALDSLEAGEELKQDYKVTLDDGNGGTVDTIVTITMIGAADAPNQAPVVEASTVTGEVIELPDGSPQENIADLTVAGDINYTDGDNDLVVAATSAPKSTGYIGTFAVGVDAQGKVTWNFSVPDSELDRFNDGDSFKQIYTVTLDDGKGGTVAQDVTVTLKGANDIANGAPIVTGTSTLVGEVTELADGDVDENIGDLTAAGTINFTDVNDYNVHTATVVADGTNYLGELTLDPVVQGAGFGEVAWSFKVNDADLDALTSAYTVEQTYTVTLDDGKGGVTTETIAITIKGADEAPNSVPTIVVTSDVDGAVAELADKAEGENTANLTDTGIIEFSDADMSDVHKVTAVATGENYLGTFTLSPVTQGTAATDTNPAINGKFNWTFTVPDADLDQLAAGEQLVQTYNITLDDGNGGTIMQSVAVTITGAEDAANSAPVISVDPVVQGTVTELADRAEGENTTDLSVSGEVAFTDADAADMHTVTAVANGANYFGELALSPAANGKFTWTFTVPDADIDALTATQTVTQSYKVTLSDGNGGIVDQVVTVKIKGADDAPNVAPVITVEASDLVGAVTELADGAVDEGTATLSATGAIAYTDGDGDKVVSTTVTDNGADYIGAFTTTIDAEGKVTWAFNVLDGALDSLKQGETIVQSYDVALSDGNGGIATETVTITMNGADDNEAPVITSESVLTGEVTELPDGSANEGTAALTATGAIAYTDADGDSVVEVSATDVGINYIGEFTTDIDSEGKVTWAFNVLDGALDSLDAGETIVQSYDVTIKDGKGGSATKTVAVTMNGAQDVVVNTAPVIVTEGTVLTGAVTELADGSVDEGTATLSATGAINYTDAEGDKVVSATVTDNGADYIGAFTTAIDSEGKVTWAFNVVDGALDSLNAGETIVQSYDIALDDGNGGVTTQTVTVTMNGADDNVPNSAPVIDAANTTATATIYEIDAGAPGEKTADVKATGVIAFTDANAGDMHSASVTPQDSNFYGNFKILSVIDGKVNWEFKINDSILDGLDEGESGSQSYDVTIDDGNGGTATQTVTITAFGKGETIVTNPDNVAPIIDAANTTAAATIYEIDAGAPGEKTADVTATGAIAFNDANAGDVHTASVASSVEGFYGDFNILSVADGKVNWEFKINDSILDGLDEGESGSQSYDIKIDDGKGGTVIQTVTITAFGKGETIVSNPVNVINGTDGIDYLSGTDGDDLINLGGGQDVVKSSAGNDVINGGGSEYDQVNYAGSADDYLFTANTNGSVNVVKANGTDTLNAIDGIWFEGERAWYDIDQLVADDAAFA